VDGGEVVVLVGWSPGCLDSSLMGGELDHTTGLLTVSKGQRGAPWKQQGI